MDPTNLLAQLTWQLGVVCVLAFAFGAVGGLLHEGKPASEAAMSGVGAAAAVLYLTNPKTGVALIGGSVAAGYAGQAILAGLEARAVAMLAEADARAKGQDVREALAAHDTLTSAPRGTPTPEDEARLALAQAAIDRLQTKYQMKGQAQ
jgi:hypothetical protein